MPWFAASGHVSIGNNRAQSQSLVECCARQPRQPRCRQCRAAFPTTLIPTSFDGYLCFIVVFRFSTVLVNSVPNSAYGSSEQTYFSLNTTVSGVPETLCQRFSMRSPSVFLPFTCWGSVWCTSLVPSAAGFRGCLVQSLIVVAAQCCMLRKRHRQQRQVS